MKGAYLGLLIGGCVAFGIVITPNSNSSSHSKLVTETIKPAQAQEVTNKTKNCNIHDFNDHIGCDKGDLAVFLPTRWSDDQLSLKFIATACDKSNPIYMTKGGVICTYSPITPADEYDASNFVTDKRNEQKIRKFEILLSAIEDPNSQFRDIGGNRWLKVISLGKGEPAECPVELKITYQKMNEDGKLVGKPSATKTSVVESLPDNVLIDYPEGSVIEYARIDREDLLGSERGVYTIVSAKTYKPAPPSTAQGQNKPQKQASSKAKPNA